MKQSLKLIERFNTLKRYIKAKHIKVVRRNTSYMAEQGWKRYIKGVNSYWEGYYRTRWGSFKGKIEGLDPLFYIYKPPNEMKSHRHWICFSSRDNGWYSIHFRIKPKDLDSSVIEIERMIYESFFKKSA